MVPSSSPAFIDTSTTTDQDGASLIAQYLAGDGLAFERFVHLHSQRCFRLALRLSDNAADAEDATQSAFLLAFQHAAAFKSGTSARAWLSGIVANCCHEQRRRERQITQRHRRASVAVVAVTTIATADESEVQQDHIENELQKIPETDRLILWLRFAEDLTFRHIAQRLALPQKTIESRALRTVAKIRTRLSQRRWFSLLGATCLVPFLPGAYFAVRPQLAEKICSTLRSQGGTSMQAFIAGAAGAANATNTPWWGPLTSWTFASSVVGAAVIIASITAFRPTPQAPQAPQSSTSNRNEIAASRPVIIHNGKFDLFSDMTSNDYNSALNEQPTHQIAISMQVITCDPSVWDRQGLPSRLETSAILTSQHLSQINALLEDGHCESLYSPKLSTNPDQLASIESRTEQAYICDYSFIDNKLDPTIAVLSCGFKIVCRFDVAGSDVRLSLFNYRQVTPLSFVVSSFSYPRIHNNSRAENPVALQYPIEEPEVGLRHSELAQPITIPQDRTLMMIVSASALELHRGNANFARQLGQQITQTPSTKLKQLPLVEPLQIVLLSAKIVPVAVEDDSEDPPTPVGIAAR